MSENGARNAFTTGSGANRLATPRPIAINPHQRETPLSMMRASAMASPLSRSRGADTRWIATDRAGSGSGVARVVHNGARAGSATDPPDETVSAPFARAGVGPRPFRRPLLPCPIPWRASKRSNQSAPSSARAVATATHDARDASIAGVQTAPLQANVQRSHTPALLMLKPMLNPRSAGKSGNAAMQAACIWAMSASPPSGSGRPPAPAAAVSVSPAVQRKK